MGILEKHYGLDTRNQEQYRRYYALINEKKEIVLIVQANVYFPDCFKWDKLFEKGWYVHVIGHEIPEGVTNERKKD